MRACSLAYVLAHSPTYLLTYLAHDLQNNQLAALGFVRTMPALRKMSIAGNDFMRDKVPTEPSMY